MENQEPLQNAELKTKYRYAFVRGLITAPVTVGMFYFGPIVRVPEIFDYIIPWLSIIIELLISAIPALILIILFDRFIKHDLTNWNFYLVVYISNILFSFILFALIILYAFSTGFSGLDGLH